MKPGAAVPARLSASVRTTHGADFLRYEVGLAAPGTELDGAGFFIEVEGDRVPPPVDRHDFAVLALIFTAMRCGLDLHVEGRLSAALLANLEEFQRAWVTWYPQRYRRVHISCDEELAPVVPPATRRAVLAYSGGVDSNCALVEELEPSDRRDRHELLSAVLIHGFDVPLAETEGFAATLAAARSVTTAVGVPLTIVRTDMRERLAREWGDEFGAVVAASLSVFSPLAAAGILGSDGDYTELLIPWGSNLVSNPMLSSDVFRIETVCSALPRTERVGRIAAHPAVIESLRVCWGDKTPGRNCGHCEKCMRTKLSFLALGLPVPASLGAAPGFADIMAIKVLRRRRLHYYREIDTAAAHARKMPLRLRLAIRLMIWKNLLLLPFRGLRRMRRNIGRRLTGRPLLPR